MFGNILHLIVHQHRIGIDIFEIISDVRQRVGFDFYVGLNASAVAHFTPIGRVKNLGQRVGYVLNVSPVTVFVVDGLNTSAAGNVVFVSRKFQTPVVRQIYRHLHEPLAIRAGTENHSTVKVLQAAARNLSGTRCAAVD